MKYKVGDKVRIRKDLQVGRRYGGVTARKGMKENFGAVGTIELIHNNGYRLDVSDFWWSEEMLEEVDEMRINIETDGTIVTAQLGYKIGVAKCAPEDEFDIFTGAKLALERLEKQCKPYGWLKEATCYFYPDLSSIELYGFNTYNDCPFVKRQIKRGLIFQTKEEAIEAAKKMLAVLKESDSNDA